MSKAGGEPRGCCAWPRIPWHSGPRGMVHCRGAEARSWSCISIAWHVPNDKLSSSAISLIIKCRFPRITALTWSTVSLVRAVDGQPVCGSSSMDVWPFLNREYHSNILDRLNAVSTNAYCSISYVSVAISLSFWQSLMQTHCSFSTSISQYNGGKKWLHCRSTHSRLSQAATRSSGMWHQEMLPSVLHGCHFNTTSHLF
jgi:hypothetical protein